MPILKSLSRNSLSGLRGSLNYVLRFGAFENKDSQVSKPMLHNLRSEASNLDAIISEFKTNETYRKVTSNRVFFYHHILSLSEYDKDKVTPKMMEKLSAKYFELKPDVISFAVAHFDENPHLHFIESATKYREGKSATLRKEEMQELKLKIEHFVQQEFPELEHSLVNHTQKKAYVPENEYQLSKREMPQKQELKEIVNYCYDNAFSKQHFIELLNQNGLLHYERSQDGIPTGVIDPRTNRKYRFRRFNISLENILKLEQEQELKKEQQLKEELQKQRSRKHRR